MNLSRRVIFVVFLFATLFAGFLFWPFILDEVITPTSLVFWLLLRIFVLSIDQKYYWSAIIFVLVFFLYRFLPQNPAADPEDTPQSSNSTLRTVGYWRDLFTFTDLKLLDEKTLKKELVRLLIALYATQQGTTVNFRLYEALEQGELPLPAHIHAYLFPEEPQTKKLSLKKRLQSVAEAPQKWIRRVTGQETAQHNRMIDEVLDFTETALEMKNDHGRFKPN